MSFTYNQSAIDDAYITSFVGVITRGEADQLNMADIATGVGGLGRLRTLMQGLCQAFVKHKSDADQGIITIGKLTLKVAELEAKLKNTQAPRARRSPARGGNDLKDK